MKIDSLYKRKGLMPSFYKVRSFFGVDDWYELNPNKIFKTFKERVPQGKYKKTYKEMSKITKLLDKEVYLLIDEDEKSKNHGVYDSDRKLIIMYMDTNKFDNFAAIAFHEMSHLLQYTYTKMKEAAICSKFDYRISTSWMIEICADMAAKKIYKYVYPDLPYNSYMLNNYKTIEGVQLLYEDLDKYWHKEHKAHKNFVLDDLNILKK